MPRRPEAGPCVGIALVRDLDRALGCGQREHELEVGLDRSLGASRLDEQARRLRVRRPGVRVDGAHVDRVEQLQPRHAGARGHRRYGGAAGRLDVRERDPYRDGVLGDPLETQRELGDHGQRPLGADEQASTGRSRRRSSAHGSRCGSPIRRAARPRARGRWRASSRAAPSSCPTRWWPPSRRGWRGLPGRRGRRARARPPPARARLG